MVEQVKGCANKEVLKLSLKSVKFDKFIHLLENNVETISCSYLVYRQSYILCVWLFGAFTVEMSPSFLKNVHVKFLSRAVWKI